MAPPDDAEGDGEGDELLEWLWDLPERYDVGIDEDPLGSGAVPAVPGVRKHLRKPGEPDTETESESEAAMVAPPIPIPVPSPAPEPVPAPSWSRYEDDRPTGAMAMDSGELYPGGDDDDGPALATILAANRRPGRFNARDFNMKDIAASVAVFLVVAIAAGVGYTVLRGNGSNKTHLAVGSTTTTQVTNNGAGNVVPVTDSTTSTSTTTPAATTTTVSVPSAVTVPGTTTTTVHRATTTTTHPTTTTTTTRPPATTTTTTTQPITTTTSTSTTTSTISTTSTTVATTTSSTAPPLTSAVPIRQPG